MYAKKFDPLTQESMGRRLRGLLSIVGLSCYQVVESYLCKHMLFCMKSVKRFVDGEQNAVQWFNKTGQRVTKKL